MTAPHSDQEDRSVLLREQVQPSFTLAYGSHPDQIAEVFQPRSSAHGWAIGIHGGFWRPAYDRVHLRNTAMALAEHGVMSVLIEYRRIPGEPRTTVDDVCLAISALSAEPDLSPTSTSKPMVWGHSAGGHLALVAGVLMPDALRGVVALAPVTDLALAELEGLGRGAASEFLGGPAVDYADIDPARQGRPDLPITLIHGTRDSLVPYSQSRRLAELWTDIECVALPGNGHFELIDPRSPVWATVTAKITN